MRKKSLPYAGNAADSGVSGFSGVFSGVRKMLFRRRKNTIFALRIRSDLPYAGPGRKRIS
ncbi:Uncharacterized protein dnm_056380 [Desulfonema magnum]|uniref:Uncharacterized protein n=1 Tax=Desulfonema magnum TaxID=45655 RepID=A0A975BQF4_9BACT|nr:Uncharacterized protein dnm_056380 [Desulfonema magnum]